MNLTNEFYLPKSQRTIDRNYKQLLEEIIHFGHQKETVQLVNALTLLGPKPMRFQLKNGIPLITERNLNTKPKGEPYLWQQAIAEICAFINGANSLEELHKYGCYWWDPLTSDEKCSRFGLPPGEMGLGFYGNAFTRFPMKNGENFNQVKAVIEQIKEFPITRTHFISPWVPNYLLWKYRKTIITPCTGWMYFEVNMEKISLVMIQRAADVPVGVPFNMFQYAVLLLMVAQVTDLIPHEFVHIIVDAHIYENQLSAVHQMLARNDRKFPLIKLNRDKKNLFDFKVDDFVLEEYNPYPAINNIPVNDV